MSSWIYVFSKFTPEALLFESLLICFLIASYAAFWVLRKRRMGAVEETVPASVVKLYLNELIGEAHDMRLQLFGLLGGKLPENLAHGVGPAIAVSGDAGLKLTALERKMAEQAAAMEKILAEKSKLEKELTDARAKGSTAAAAPGAAPVAGSEEVQKLQDKCETLEARLAEYSVIEDDLANLKRLQQENASLKAQLSGAPAAKGAASPATDAAAASVAATAQDASANAKTDPATATDAATAASDAAAAAADPEQAAQDEGAALTADAAHAKDPAAAAASDADSAAKAALSGATDQASGASAKDAAADAAKKAKDDSTQKAQDEGKAAKEKAAAGTVEGGTGSPAFEGLVDQVEKSLQPNATPADAEGKAAQKAAPATKAPAAEKSDEDLIAEFEKMLNS